MKDLFGNEITIEQAREIECKGKRNVAPNGYAARPGSGPSGETCKTCAHAVKISLSKNYWKCGLCRANWTSSIRTDIRLKSLACQFWQAKPIDENKPF